MTLAPASAFERVVVVLVACVFVAHVVRVWDEPYLTQKIALAALLDSLFYFLILWICRAGQTKPKRLPEKPAAGLDKWLD